MATAVEPNSGPRTPPTPLKLPISSLIGAVYVIAAVAIVLYVVPQLWTNIFGAGFVGNKSSDFALRYGLRALIAIVLGVVGFKLLGDRPQKGIRGGIFLVLATALLVFLIWRLIAMNVNGSMGLIAALVIGGAMIFFAVRFLSGKTGETWMIALEEQGWFHGKSYKRSLGRIVRRLTILGVIILGVTGAWSLFTRGVVPETWTLTMPFDLAPIPLLSNANYVVFFLLIALTLWVAFRSVNIPSFAEFLIATEAEMNKVSWTPRKRLAQDTVVVLTTTLLMAMFLLVVDIFWGWLLSNKYVGVLPQKTTEMDKNKQGQQAKW